MKARALLMALSATTALIGCELNRSRSLDVNLGEAVTITDSRDGQTYKVRTIGDRTWIVQNVNYGGTASNSWCYENNPKNCITYGRLYGYEAAQLACPSGFRIPDSTEWDNLFKVANSLETPTRLKSKYGWMIQMGTLTDGNGSDSIGFNILPSGMLYKKFNSSKPEFTGLGNEAAFYINGSDSTAIIVGNLGEKSFTDSPKSYLSIDMATDAISVRCINEK
jgi:uncharacterized protein (TIGR02145 family)